MDTVLQCVRTCMRACVCVYLKNCALTVLYTYCIVLWCMCAVPPMHVWCTVGGLLHRATSQVCTGVLDLRIEITK